MSKKILVVDDDEILCELFSVGFKLAGFEVFIVHNGDQAIEFLKKQWVDVITLDHDMPGLSGYEVLQKLHDEKIADNSKVIIVSANNSISRNETYQELAHDILTKPVGFRQLSQLAQQLLSEND